MMLFGQDATYKKILRYLKPDRPIVIFDVESTGLSLTNDKIIEIAYVKIWPNERIKKDTIFLDPEMGISPEATAVHRIKDSDVAGKPTFKERAQEIYDLFSESYYAGFNIINFDLPMLRREFVRVGMDFEYDVKRVIDAKEIFFYMVPRTLAAAYEYYCRKKFDNDYNAVRDADVAAEILLKQLEKYQEARNMVFLNVIHERETHDHYVDNARKFYWLSGHAHFAFSQYKDKPLVEVAKADPGFCRWIIGADFSDETKRIVQLALEGKEFKAPSRKRPVNA